MGSTKDNERKNEGRTNISVAIELPGGTVSNLPYGAKKILDEHGIKISNVSTYVCFQDKPWQDEQLLFRPHPWLAPDVPEFGDNINISNNISVAVANVGRQFGVLANLNTATHSTNDGSVAYSGNSMQINDIENPEVTQNFYSICINNATGKAVITYHCILNDKDQQKVNIALQHIEQRSRHGEQPSLNIFLEELSKVNSGINTDELSYFVKGGRPKVNLNNIPVSELIIFEQLLQDVHVSIIDNNYKNHRILHCVEKYFAVPRLDGDNIEPKDLLINYKAFNSKLEAEREADDNLQTSIVDIIDENYKNYRILRSSEKYFAVPRADKSNITQTTLFNNYKRFASKLDAERAADDNLQTRIVDVIDENYKNYRILRSSEKYFAVPREDGSNISQTTLLNNYKTFDSKLEAERAADDNLQIRINYNNLRIPKI
jgi:hypothetical protein